MNTGLGLVGPGEETFMRGMNYYVSRQGGQWAVEHGNKVCCAFPSKAEAIHAAIETAQDFGDEFHGAAVLVKGEDGQFQTLWTYGEELDRKVG
jgi:hypothetical protein